MKRHHPFIQYPRLLPSGGTVGIIAPASPVPEDKLEKALRIFSQYGFQIKVGDSIGKVYGYLSGGDELRARDLNQMFADSDIDAVICLRGGYGTPRILDLIDYDVISRNPKIFVGYSDITALHTAIHQNTGLVTFHGPMIAELAKDDSDPLTWPTLFQMLMEPEPVGIYTNMLQMTITPGEAEGRLIGGNMSLLVAALGTPYELDTRDRILFLEDVGEEPYSIDRMLTQLRLAGKLEQARGIVLTDFTDVKPKTEKPSLSLEQVFRDIVAPLGIPAYYGLKAGHCQPNLTMPIGLRVKMDAVEGNLEMLEAAVRRNNCEC